MKGYRVQPYEKVGNVVLVTKDPDACLVYVNGWYGDDCFLIEVEGDVIEEHTENVQYNVKEKPVNVEVLTMKVKSYKVLKKVLWNEVEYR